MTVEEKQAWIDDIIEKYHKRTKTKCSFGLWIVLAREVQIITLSQWQRLNWRGKPGDCPHDGHDSKTLHSHDSSQGHTSETDQGIYPSKSCPGLKTVNSKTDFVFGVMTKGRFMSYVMLDKVKLVIKIKSLT